MIKNKTYKLKLAAVRSTVRLVEIKQALDASDLSTTAHKQQLDRHDVAECILETSKPIAFDLVTDNEKTGRLVIVDNFEIAGGGVILENYSTQDSTLKEHIRNRENIWEKGSITAGQRFERQKHKSKFVVLTGTAGEKKREIARALEKELFTQQYSAFYLGLGNIAQGLDSDISGNTEEQIRRLGELARIMTEAGLLFITTIDDADDYDLETLKLLNEPNEILILNVGENNFSRYAIDLEIPALEPLEAAVKNILKLLKTREIILEYYL